MSEQSLEELFHIERFLDKPDVDAEKQVAHIYSTILKALRSTDKLPSDVTKEEAEKYQNYWYDTATSAVQRLLDKADNHLALAGLIQRLMREVNEDIGNGKFGGAQLEKVTVIYFLGQTTSLVECQRRVQLEGKFKSLALSSGKLVFFLLALMLVSVGIHIANIIR